MGDARFVGEDIIKAALILAGKYGHEKEHSRQVEEISRMLFDALSDVHMLDEEDGFILQAGAMLHDIGRTNGGKAHHKIACDIIMKAEELSCIGEGNRKIIALLARYHRKKLPDLKDDILKDISPEDQCKCEKLAAILRMADGLDRSHVSSVKDIDVGVEDSGILIKVHGVNIPPADIEYGRLKSDLFERTFRKKVLITGG